MSTYANQTNSSYDAVRSLLAAFPDAYSASQAAETLRGLDFGVELIDGPAAREPLFSRRTANAISAGAVSGFLLALLLPMLLGISMDVSRSILLMAITIPGGMAIGGFIGGSDDRPLTLRERVLQREARLDEMREPTAFLMVTALQGDIAEADDILRQNGATDVSAP